MGIEGVRYLRLGSAADWFAEETRSLQGWKILLSHLSLILIVIIYIFVGATAFYLIENPAERRIRDDGLRKIASKQREIAEALWEKTQTLDRESFHAAAEEKIDELTELALKKFKDPYVAQGFEPIDKQLWTFPNAILFVTTMLTTVGYGTPAPVSKTGRIFCVAYGLIGIPLMVVVIADIAKFVANSILVVYHRIKTSKLCKKNSKEKEKKDTNEEEEEDAIGVPVGWITLILLVFPFLGGVVVCLYEDMTLFEGFYFCFVSVFTIGLGDVVPENESFYLVTILIVVGGVILTSVTIDLVVGEYIETIHDFGRTIGQARRQALQAIFALGALGLRYPAAGRFNTGPCEPFRPDIMKGLHFADHDYSNEFEDFDLYSSRSSSESENETENGKSDKNSIINTEVRYAPIAKSETLV